MRKCVLLNTRRDTCECAAHNIGMISLTVYPILKMGKKINVAAYRLASYMVNMNYIVDGFPHRFDFSEKEQMRDLINCIDMLIILN